MQFNIQDCLRQNDNFACDSGVKSVLMKQSGLASKPLYSIVIPTYKRLETCKETIDSALSQSFDSPYEVVVVEDNPESGSAIEKYVLSLDDVRVCYYKNSSNLGLVGNFNRAVSLAAAERVVLLHDDDFLFPEYLSCIDKVFTRRTDADIVCVKPVKWHEDRGEARPVTSAGKRGKFRLWKPLSDGEPFCRNFLPTGVTFLKQTFMRTGGFDHISGPSTDLFYIVRVGKSVNYYMYERPLFVYRWSENESLKFNTRVDFISAGLPLRQSILEEHGVPRLLRNLLLKNYCAISKRNMERDFPGKEFCVKGFILPRGRFEALLAAKLQDIVSWLLSARRFFCGVKI